MLSYLKMVAKIYWLHIFLLPSSPCVCLCLCVLQLQVEDDQGVNLGIDNSLTLRRLLVWTYDPKVRLKSLAALVDFCQGLCV